jgi:hypothetical protein
MQDQIPLNLTLVLWCFGKMTVEDHFDYIWKGNWGTVTSPSVTLARSSSGKLAHLM